MNASLRWRSLALITVLCLCAVPRLAPAQDIEVVIEWNRILQTTVATPGALPATIFFARPYAVLHVAIFEALNSIDFLYTPYAVRVEASADASRDAAAAQAAHDVMAAMFPGLTSTYDAALAATLNRLPSAAAQSGARVGAAAAREILALRSQDGWSRTPPTYILPSIAGFWQPTPPANAPAAFTQYPDVQSFVIGSTEQFLAEPPPALTSPRYATDFNDVKTIGSASSTTRTAEQTLVARLWANVGTPTTSTAVWNNIARDLIRARGVTQLNAARLYALLAMAQHDGLQTSFNGKFLYGLWRPVTAIRQADRDGNAATDADPGWLPLLTTPPYPSYPGNMSCIGASQSRVLTRFFGADSIPTTVTWATADGVGITRSYAGLRQIADEEGASREYGGIHFHFDTLASFGVCTPLADYVFDNTLRPKFTP